MQASGPWVSYLLIGAMLVVLALRLRRMSRVRRLRLETLWIVPAVLMAVLVLSLVEVPPRHSVTWIAMAFALGIGGGVGWRRGALMKISIDPETHRLNQQASPTALLFVVVLIVARRGLRYEASALGLDLAMVTAALTAFTVGLISATRAEMFVRGQRLLADARAYAPGKSTGPTISR